MPTVKERNGLVRYGALQLIYFEVLTSQMVMDEHELELDWRNVRSAW